VGFVWVFLCRHAGGSYVSCPEAIGGCRIGGLVNHIEATRNNVFERSFSRCTVR
jgi:hypothetical protein